MNRLFRLSLLIALTLGSTQLLAVDFGQVRVLSNLGQPLLAEIPLRGATPAELQNLSASLASAGEYERAGIVGGRTSVPLSFSVVAGPGGQHFIRVASTAPVDDPYLDLLLDVNTPTGRSVHEFAILLDPPGMPAPSIAGGGQQSASGQAADAAAPARPTPPTAPAAVKPSAPAKVAAVAPATPPAQGKPASTQVVKGMYGPVERGQTLSGIAQQTLPAGVDLNQMLLAIKQANPDAFYRDNINTLKSGVVLRVPSAADAQAVTVAAAMAEVQRQNGDWRTGSVAAPVNVATAAAAGRTAGTASTTTTLGGDRLAVLAAKAGGAPGGQGGAAAESATELRKDMLRAQESLASERQQVADLQAHVKELDDVNRKSERLLALKDNEIAELQARLAAARKAGFTAPASAATSKANLAADVAVAKAQSAARALAVVAAASTSQQAPATAGSAAAMASASSVASGAAASPAPTSAANTAPAAPANPVAPVQPWYLQSWAWIAAGGVVVLLILLGLLGRQRKHPAPVRTKTAPSLADSFGSPGAEGGSSVDDVDHGELLDRLAEHPDDVNLHLQLVTLYYSRRDVEHFEAAAEAMYAHIADPAQDEWQDVVHMGEDLVPGHPLFAEPVQPPVLAADAAMENFNIDDYVDDPAPTSSAAEVPPDATESAAPSALDFQVPEFVPEEPDGLHAVSQQLDVSPDRSPAYEPAPTEVDAAGREPYIVPAATDADGVEDPLGEFNDDPIDTKLDLARAYLDMGDEEGARAMLDEVLKEGSQMQKDVATGLLGGLQH